MTRVRRVFTFGMYFPCGINYLAVGQNDKNGGKQHAVLSAGHEQNTRLKKPLEDYGLSQNRDILQICLLEAVFLYCRFLRGLLLGIESAFL